MKQVQQKCWTKKYNWTFRNGRMWSPRGFQAIKWVDTSVNRKKSPNVFKSCPKMISLKMIDFDTFTKIA